MSFFRRNAFAVEKVKPKWHILEKQDGGLLTAKCGYSYKFLLESPLTKEEVKTKSLICKKCLQADPPPRGDRFANQDGKGL